VSRWCTSAGGPVTFEEVGSNRAIASLTLIGPEEAIQVERPDRRLLKLLELSVDMGGLVVMRLPIGFSDLKAG
jgi:hypothetical protein